MKKYILDDKQVDQDTWERAFRRNIIEQALTLFACILMMGAIFAITAPSMPRETAPAATGQSLMFTAFLLAMLVLFVVTMAVFFFRSLRWKSVKMAEFTRHLSDVYIRNLEHSPLNPALTVHTKSDCRLHT